MFNKVANFRMLPTRPAAPGVNAPANDNRRNGRPCASRRARAPRLICRWSLSATTGRPVCRWELDNADEPNPRLRQPSTDRFTKLSSNCLIRKERSVRSRGAKSRAHYAGLRARPMQVRANARCCMHVTRRCDLTALPVQLLPFANSLQ